MTPDKMSEGVGILLFNLGISFKDRSVKMDSLGRNQYQYMYCIALPNQTEITAKLYH